MLSEGIVKTTCGICNLSCGMLIHMKDGKPVKVEGDPDNPANRGALCIRGYSSLELLDNPKRLKYPLKRAGEKGEGKWQRITWDEALKIIGSMLNESKSRYGAESVVFIGGAAKIYADRILMRFANVFGSPNISTMAHTCFIPRIQAAMVTHGFKPVSDYEHPSACIVNWGLNTERTAHGEYDNLLEGLAKGAKLIVIDPLETNLAKKADITLRLRPSTDLALALGMIYVIINEGLYDKEFVEKWTTGFEELKQHVQDYPPEKVEQITWAPAGTIRRAARLYATSKPACIGWGNGLDTSVNNFQTCRAISILRAITGNLGAPGGDLEWSDPGIVDRNGPDLLRSDVLPAEVLSRRISAGDHLLPPLLYSTPYGVVKAMLKSEPYPVRAALVMGSNPLHTYPESRMAYDAFRSLDFLAVTDLFMTPTAALADIVLPAASFLEIDDIHQCEKKTVVGIVQKVAEVGEAWSNMKMWNELAKVMGLGEYFWENDEQVFDYLLKPAGLSFDEFRKIGIISGNKEYRNHLKKGFNTPSRKVELYSARLKKWGFDPIPVYHEPPETFYSNPELAEEFPLIFSNWKSSSFHHSSGRQLKSLREGHKEPVTMIHAETAAKLGIEEGDPVFIETSRGRIKQKATLSDSLDPRVVYVDFGWWFPEKEENLFDWAEANINVLTENGRNFSKEMGTPHLRGIVCRVYKA